MTTIRHARHPLASGLPLCESTAAAGSASDVVYAEGCEPVTCPACRKVVTAVRRILIGRLPVELERPTDGAQPAQAIGSRVLSGPASAMNQGATAELITQMRKMAAGNEVWCVCSPDGNSICMSFRRADTATAEADARAWLADHCARNSNGIFREYVVKKYMSRDEKDKLLLQAADALERLGG